MAAQVGVHLHGEVDLATVPVLEAALDQLVVGDLLAGGGAARPGGEGHGDVHVDLAGLQFVDLSGASVLVAAAAQLSSDRRLVLHDPSPALSRILDGFWEGVARIRVSVT